MCSGERPIEQSGSWFPLKCLSGQRDCVGLWCSVVAVRVKMKLRVCCDSSGQAVVSMGCDEE